MSTISSTVRSSTAITLPPLTTQTVENVTIALADTEQSHSFPAQTRHFRFRARTPAEIKYTSTSGASGTTYGTLPKGCNYVSPLFDTALTTIYFQSPTAGVVVELESWA